MAERRNLSNKKSSTEYLNVQKVKNDSKKTEANNGKIAEVQHFSNVDYDDTFQEQHQLFSVHVIEQNVGDCLAILDDTVMHSYVSNLNQLPIVAPYFDEEKMKKEPYQFFHITKLVYERDEFSVSKLSAIFQSLSGKNCTLVLMIKNQRNTTNFYLGVRNHEEKDFTGSLRQMLEMSFKGQFPGSDFNSKFSVEDMKIITDELMAKSKSISSVSCVPDFKQDKGFLENKDFLQGLEKFVLSMQNKDYTAIFVADAVPYDELVAYRTQLEAVYTQLSPFANINYQINTSNSKSNADTEQENKANTTTEGESDTEGTTDSESKAQTSGETDTTGTTDTHTVNSSETDTTSKGKTVTNGEHQSTTDGIAKTNTVTLGSSQSIGANAGGSLTFAPFGIGGGVNAGVSAGLSMSESYSHSTTKSHAVTKGTNHSIALSNTISKALTKGIADSKAINKSKSFSKSNTNTQTHGVTYQHGRNSSYSETFSFGSSKTITDTFGYSQGISMQSQNMMLLNMLERIKKQIKRLDECESIGMWNCAAYFLSNNKAITEIAASTYRSLVSGENSGVERSAINTWTDKESMLKLTNYLTHFCHPKFEYFSSDIPCIISPASLISTKELAIELSLPRKSVCGLPVIEQAKFGQQVVINDIIENKDTVHKKIDLGKIYHLNTVTDIPVELDINSLTMHTFVTGSTGAGKSNTVYHLLDVLSNRKIPYLVIEPAKGEYRTKFKDANVYGTNPNNGEMLRLNPFAFPSDIHVQEHIDKLAELFNVCWVMYAAMPAVLKDSIIRAYESAGWDLNKSINTVNNSLFPTFEDVLREIDNVIKESDYSGDTSSDYKGALKTRLRSLTNGINGMIFSNNEISSEQLFDKNTIIDLSRVGSTETKSLMMGIIVLKLQEYRMSTHNGSDYELRHITVLEEAHNLLKKTSTEQSQETANLQGKSVEMLTNSIAEMRTYGEGFVIVDQAPDLLDTAVIRNTNTKIVMRLPEGTDREITGMSMALDDNQLNELSRLPQGVAAIYQNNWQESVLCALPKFQFVDLPVISKSNVNEYDEVETLRLLLNNDIINEYLLKALLNSDAPAKIRKNIIQNFEKKNLLFEWAVSDYISNRFNWKCAFEGTNNTCTTIEEIGSLMVDNLSELFPNFNSEEINKVCYYVCRAAHEVFPDNEEIEKLRVNCFKKG